MIRTNGFLGSKVPRPSRALTWALIALPCLLGTPALTLGESPSRQGVAASVAPSEIEVEGHIVCLAELARERFGTDLPSDHPHLCGFESTNKR